MNRFALTIQSLSEVFGDPGLQSYYPESQRKSRIQIMLEHLWWMVRYREINHFYYFYGCDRRNGPAMSDYMSKKDFIRKRDKLNAFANIGDKIINYNCLLQDKFLFSQYLKSLGFATPQAYGLADKNFIRIISPRQKLSWEEFIKSFSGQWFIKDVVGERGEKVFRLEIQNQRIRLGGRHVCLDEVKDAIGQKNILQEVVVQHELLNQMNSSCINTMRLVTARAGSRIEPISALLRLGVKANSCDNLALGGIAVGINLSDGALSERGVYKPGFGKWTAHHPNSGFIFKGARLPYFSKVLEAACRLHSFFYGTHSIGWDIAFGPEGPIFLEGNNSWEIPTLQVFDKDLIAKFNRTLEPACGKSTNIKIKPRALNSNIYVRNILLNKER